MPPVETKPEKNHGRGARATIFKSVVAILVLAVLAAGVRTAWWWAHYPHVPDVQRVSFDEAVAFMAGDDFNRLTQGDRKRYVLAVIDRLNDKRFPDLIGMMFHRTGDRQRAARNVMQLPREDREAIADHFGQLFLDKFYEEPPAARKLYLTSFALAQQGEIRQHPERFGLPQPEQLKGEMSRFFTRQPPHTQAQAGQFLTELRKTREQLGLRQPWQTR